MITDNILAKLKLNNLTISFAESMTGGSLSYSFTKKAGASKVFMGAIIAYNEAIKSNILKISKELIQKHSIVSKEVSQAMLKGLEKLIRANIYVAITGNAGPTYEKNTHQLEAFICIKINEDIYDYHLSFDNDNRVENINKANVFIINKLENLIT